MNYNTDNLMLLFDKGCMEVSEANKLQELEFHLSSDILLGFVKTYAFAAFVNEIGSNFTNLFKHCLLDISFETMLYVEHTCRIIETNNIYLDSIMKPNAWYLDMIDNKTDNSYKYSEGIYKDMVDLWILDTGVYRKHKEFEGEEVIDADPAFGQLNLQHPHGTGCASIAAGRHYGATRNVTMYSFPVCRYGGQCGQSDIEKGLQAVLVHLMNRRESKQRTVINLSVGSSLRTNVMNTSLGIYYDGLFRTIENLGGIVVTSAGNGNEDACTWLYSYSEHVISVGSINKNYQKSSYSNYGKCVDIWSFGEAVPIGYSISNNSSIEYKSGTSFSSPLIAGLVINILREDISLTREQILNKLYVRVDNKLIAYYNCDDISSRCCRSKYINTRLDIYCRGLTIPKCTKNCEVDRC